MQGGGPYEPLAAGNLGNPILRSLDSAISTNALGLSIWHPYFHIGVINLSLLLFFVIVLAGGPVCVDTKDTRHNKT